MVQRYCGLNALVQESVGLSDLIASGRPAMTLLALRSKRIAKKNRAVGWLIVGWMIVVTDHS